MSGPVWNASHCVNAPSFSFKALSALLLAFLMASMVGGASVIASGIDYNGASSAVTARISRTVLARVQIAVTAVLQQ